MNNMHFLSTCEVEGIVEVLEDLIVLTDPSEYLIDEAILAVKLLKSSETVSMEAYLEFNKKEQDND